MTQDPIGLAGGVNLYAYAGNNPVSFGDPFGLCPWCRVIDFVGRAGPAVMAGARWAATQGTRLWNGTRALFQSPAVQQSVDDVANVADDVASRVHAASAGAHEIAAAGGRHAGLIQTYAGRSLAQIQRAIRSLEGRVADHLDKIANPAKYVENWSRMDPRAQQGVLRFWENEAANYAQQAEVLRGIAANL